MEHARRVGLILSIVVTTVGIAAARAAEPSPPAQRPLWTGSKVAGFPDPPPPYRCERVYPKLTIKQPAYVTTHPDTKELLVIGYSGGWGGATTFYRFAHQPTVTAAENFFTSQYTFYGMAFHPKYAANGFVYLGGNGPFGAANPFNRILRYRIERTPPYRLDPKSETLIIEWASNGHNGADLGFGPDGMLYITSGDGTSDSDRNGTGQTLDDLLGGVLRIDVDHPAPGKAYAIPPDNPFVKRPGVCGELWAYGLRNPWRMHFDRKTGQLWVGNNGQDLWEQIYLIRKGENYGWPVYEGSHPFHLYRKLGPDPHVPPTLEHHHSEARSLTGGIVYEGKRLPELAGAYVYGDFSTGKIWAARHDGTKVTWRKELADTPHQITGFGADPDGELLYTDHGGGGIHTLAPTPQNEPRPAFPRRLSETGIFKSVKDHQVDPGLIPHQVVVPQWTDGARKIRFLGLPGAEKITFTAAGGWNFPDGTVLVESLAMDLLVEGQPARPWLETRLLVRQQGEWSGFSYAWNEDQTDADLVANEGMQRMLEAPDPKSASGSRKQLWHYPSRSDCLVCHSRAANFALGPSRLQMRRPIMVAGKPVDQLDWLKGLEVFQNPQDVPDSRADTSRLVDPFDPKAPLEQRARSYLHANCSSCHVEAGGGNSPHDFLFTTPLANMKLVDVAPAHKSLGVFDAKLIAPGAPERSIVLMRMANRGDGHMPPIGTSRADDDGVRLLRLWIKQMPRAAPKPP